MPTYKRSSKSGSWSGYGSRTSGYGKSWPTYSWSSSFGSSKSGSHGFGKSSTGTKSFGSSSASPITWSATKFNATKKQIQKTISSYRTLSSQFSGASTKNYFSPSTAQKWIKFVGGGACVYKFNQQQFCRYFGSQWNYNQSTSAAFKYLRKNFGAGIKAVAHGKGNTWLIAATNVNGSPFKNYNWTNA
jgi:hypothetical protein